MASEQVKAKITSAPATIGKEGAERPNPALERVDKTYECTADFPATLDEAIERWGKELCYNRMMGSVKIDCQSAMRTFIKSEEFSETGLQKLVAEFNPSPKKAGVSMEEKIQSHLADLDETALEAMLEKVRIRKAESESDAA